MMSTDFLLEAGDKISSSMKSIKIQEKFNKISSRNIFFSPVPEKKKEWYSEMEEEVCAACPKMTYQQRIVGCIFFMFIGLFLSLGSLTRVFRLLAGNPTPFATMYTTGNVISLCSTCFLYGPWSQAKKMLAPTRAIATGIYFFFMIVTLFLAFCKYYIPLRGLLLVISTVCQFLALCWYSISFIPFARDWISAFCFDNCCKCLKEEV